MLQLSNIFLILHSQPSYNTLDEKWDYLSVDRDTHLLMGTKDELPSLIQKKKKKKKDDFLAYTGPIVNSNPGFHYPHTMLGSLVSLILYLHTFCTQTQDFPFFLIKYILSKSELNYLPALLQTHLIRLLFLSSPKSLLSRTWPRTEASGKPLEPFHQVDLNINKLQQSKNA